MGMVQASELELTNIEEQIARLEARKQELLNPPPYDALSPEARSLFDDFDEAAKTQGWEEDMGVGSSVKVAETKYLFCKAALEIYISKLEGR